VPSNQFQAEGNGTANGAASVVLDVLRDPRQTRVILGGELDMHTIDEVRRTLEAECDTGPAVLDIDLAAVEFIDSHGLSLFADAHRRLAGNGSVLRLVSPTDHVRRVLALTRLDELLGVEPGADYAG
jgi:anti-anti-sigma factor